MEWNMKRIITASLVLVLIAGTAVYAQFTRSSAIAFRVNSVSETKDGPNVAGRSFKKGQKVWFNVHVSGLVKDKQNNFDLEADFAIMDKDGKNRHGKGKVMNKKVQAGKSNSFNLHFSIQIGANSKPGKHTLEIEVKDKVAGKYNIHHIAFDVR